jgi:hypothetical protein
MRRRSLYHFVPKARACQSVNHVGHRQKIARGASTDPCILCGKVTCTLCEGSSSLPSLCDACWADVRRCRRRPVKRWGAAHA